MKRFRFHSVLRYRQQIKEQKQLEFSRLQRRLLAEFSRLNLLEEAHRKGWEQLCRRQEEGMRIKEMALFEAYLEGLSFQTDQQRAVLHGLAGDVEAKREELLEAEKKRKILEKLKEVEAEMSRQEELKRETRAYDEISANKHARGLSRSGSREMDEEALEKAREIL